jgi:hypothetical protein
MNRAIVLVTVAVASTANADDLSWLGPPRQISRASSASRDTPALNLMIAPRDVRTAGGELAIATVRGNARTWRFGFAGLLELESDGETTGLGNAFPAAQGNLLWRGSYAYYAALSLDAAAARWCDGCAIELAAQYRHESQHYTGSNHGDAGMDVTDQPFVGDDVIVDAAVAVDRPRWRVSARALAFVFVPDRSSYRGGPGLDLHARWKWRPRTHPFVSGYAEQLHGTELRGRRFADAYLVRAMAGVALASSYGDVMLYLAADVGNRKGIRGLTEEATLGFGIRLALGGPGDERYFAEAAH